MRYLLALLSLCLIGISALGQEKRPYNFSVSAGAGWFYYVNTLKTQASSVKQGHIGFSSRVLWEPEHRLSLGGELGYYTIYTVNIDSTALNASIGEVSLSAIPILLCFKMRITPHFYVSGGQGMTVFFSNVKTPGSTIESTELSLSDLQLSAMYRKPVNDRFHIEAELKYFNFGKTEDYGFSVQAVVTYMFRLNK